MREQGWGAGAVADVDRLQRAQLRGEEGVPAVCGELTVGARSGQFCRARGFVGTELTAEGEVCLVFISLRQSEVINSWPERSEIETGEPL